MIFLRKVKNYTLDKISLVLTKGGSVFDNFDSSFKILLDEQEMC